MKIIWISVKDSLPDKGEKVLVTDGERVCLHFKQSAFNFKGDEGEDLYSLGDLKSPDGDWIDCCRIDKPTYWAHLPFPPMKEKK